MSGLRVFIADDHALVRAGLRSLLAEMPGVEIAGEAGDGQEALRLVRETRPDVLMLDIAMPGLNGLEVAARVAKEQPRTKVIIVSMHGDDESVRRAFLSGAVGYLLKNSDRAELELALRAAARGDTFVSPSVSRKLVDALTDPDPSRVARAEVLTPRQREVLQLIAEGLSNKEIAARLNLGVKTIETHRTEVMQRLGIHGVAGLVRYAIRVGLVRADS